ncbi:hypothetical protein LX32DRAFT_427697 [Colletotrichum zoysiae]|uniref:Uncharacterized protein n=1 Tax=Colletotrichum zoysiae TaxID=1216348 RepID=A0AAD9HGE3_9PEZI|nr:hypothetical protein LX32DRAFT_427697 [Colletotrichum zoysiae]
MVRARRPRHSAMGRGVRDSQGLRLCHPVCVLGGWLGLAWVVFRRRPMIHKVDLDQAREPTIRYTLYAVLYDVQYLRYTTQVRNPWLVVESDSVPPWSRATDAYLAESAGGWCGQAVLPPPPPPPLSSSSSSTPSQIVYIRHGVPG